MVCFLLASLSWLLQSWLFPKCRRSLRRWCRICEWRRVRNATYGTLISLLGIVTPASPPRSDGSGCQEGRTLSQSCSVEVSRHELASPCPDAGSSAVSPSPSTSWQVKGLWADLDGLPSPVSLLWLKGSCVDALHCCSVRPHKSLLCCWHCTDGSVNSFCVVMPLSCFSLFCVFLMSPSAKEEGVCFGWKMGGTSMWSVTWVTVTDDYLNVLVEISQSF